MNIRAPIYKGRTMVGQTVSKYQPTSGLAAKRSHILAREILKACHSASAFDVGWPMTEATAYHQPSGSATSTKPLRDSVETVIPIMAGIAQLQYPHGRKEGATVAAPCLPHFVIGAHDNALAFDAIHVLATNSFRHRLNPCSSIDA